MRCRLTWPDQQPTVQRLKIDAKPSKFERKTRKRGYENRSMGLVQCSIKPAGPLLQRYLASRLEVQHNFEYISTPTNVVHFL